MFLIQNAYRHTPPTNDRIELLIGSEARPVEYNATKALSTTLG